jgi:hypothetical protein
LALFSNLASTSAGDRIQNHAKQLFTKASFDIIDATLPDKLLAKINFGDLARPNEPNPHDISKVVFENSGVFLKQGEFLKALVCKIPKIQARQLDLPPGSLPSV